VAPEVRQGRLFESWRQRAPGIAERDVVFLNSLAILSGLLFVYILAQFYGLLFVDNRGYLNNSVMFFSILVNIITLGVIVFVLKMLRRWRGAAGYGPWAYRLTVIGTAAFLVNGLIHIHLVGSQNSMHQLLVVAVLLVASWFLRWRELALFFVFGNLGLALVVALEWKGVLTYAPLFARHDVLATIFLDWRTVLGQSINYVLVLTVCTALVWRLRHELEISEHQLKLSNDSLRREVEERTRSENEKAELILKLQASLDQVRTLHGLLPICMNCKKIRNDEGYWQKLEDYLRKHAPEIEFAHGLCPDCIEELYPDDWEVEAERE
jgi:hypothetical protein